MTPYQQKAHEIADLVREKQEAYGCAFDKSGEVLKILYPDGISADQMQDALATTRVIDKLFRIATKKQAFGESPWDDILGYALLAATRDSR